MPKFTFSAPQNVLTALKRLAKEGERSELITRLIITEARSRGFAVDEMTRAKPLVLSTLDFAKGDEVVWRYSTQQKGNPRSYPTTVVSVGPKLVTIDVTRTKGSPRRYAVPPHALKAKTKV